ncbi:MAG TPA: SatD family protein [Nocardioides sp.]
MTFYAVIGDLVGSRRTDDRDAVQTALADALREVDRRIPSVDGLAPTVGDEFQGLYPTLGQALRATLQVRLLLRPVVDTRYGVGLGDRTVLDADRTPPLQDGSAWWSARAAIDALGRPATRRRRTWFEPAEGVEPPCPPDVVNALLLCRDALVDRIGPTAHPMLLAALDGASQREVARAVGVSESAVSQQYARGIGAVRDAQELLDAALGEATAGR